ncbi:hypothetical protein HGM15179_020420 [Zosterops borbonicus]|uniref:Uncharacterized protein n=1 Tax=Zosterops borbonicus TaxID=364589 RepID=A0A8K1D8T6_9PASS|nr:hypothetical protein HGM15179_020420 [Zosterops borbonicus]
MRRGKYLEENCHDDSKEKNLIAIIWALAHVYHKLLDPVGQQKGAGGQGDKSAATPVTQAAANTPATLTAAKPDREPKSAAKPDNRPETAAKPDSESKALAIALVKKHTHKTDRPVDDDPGEGPSVPPDKQSEAQPTDTQSEAEQTGTRPDPNQLAQDQEPLLSPFP